MQRSRIFFALSVAFLGLLNGFLILSEESSFRSLGRLLWRTAITVDVPFSWETLPPSRSLEWRRCFSGLQCARLIVPLNYSDPTGQEAVIAIIRKPSPLEGTRLHGGPILFNPGGPGGSGVEFIQGRSGDLLSTIVGPRFDVVGFDPRGIGRSIPRVSFFQTDVERALWEQGLKGLEVVNNSDEGIARTWARSHVMGKLAAATDNGYLRQINTPNTARDMLAIVNAFGRTRIQYWGFSYGSILGATFAAMFPDNVERLVIDGVVDAENYYGAFLDNNLQDTDSVMNSFFSGCAEAGPDRCDFWAPTAEEINKNLTNLYNSIRSKPLPVSTPSNHGVVDYSTLRGAVFTALYSPISSFQMLAKALAQLSAGDGRLIFDMHHSPPYQCSCNTSEPKYSNIREALFAVVCNDSNDVPGDLEYSEEYFKAFSNVSNWAELWAAVRLSCVEPTGWPEFPKNHFQGPFEVNTSYPVLLVGNIADPATPLWAANKMSRGFENSLVLTQDSAGHCSISASSLCTQKYIRQYFADGTLPKHGTICPAVGEAFPGSPIERSRREIYNAVSELSKTPAIPLPFLVINPRDELQTKGNCYSKMN